MPMDPQLPTAPNSWPARLSAYDAEREADDYGPLRGLQRRRFMVRPYLEVSKLAQFAVLAPPQADVSVSKFVQYVVLKLVPSIPTPPQPRNWGFLASDGWIETTPPLNKMVQRVTPFSAYPQPHLQVPYRVSRPLPGDFDAYVEGPVLGRLVQYRMLTPIAPPPPYSRFAGLNRQALLVGGATQVSGFSRLALSNASGTRAGGFVRVVLGRTAGIVLGGIVRMALVGVFNSDFGPIPVFPDLPQGFPIKISPLMDTIVGTVKSLREVRVAQRLFPLWDIEILFEELRDQGAAEVPFAPFLGFHQYRDLCQLWLMMYGRTGVFAFNCPWDNSRTDQLIGTGDGITVSFVAYRTWGIGTTATKAPVGAINDIIDVRIDGALVPPTFYEADRNKLVFFGADGVNRPPSPGSVITMTFTYYYLCRFVEDDQDFEEFSKNRWAVKSMKFRAVTWT